MQDRVTVQLYKLFADNGFGVLRFNFRGIGRSQGVFDNGMGELSDEDESKLVHGLVEIPRLMAAFALSLKPGA